MNKPGIHIKKLSVETIKNGSGIFHGENTLHNYEGSSIQNEGFGEVVGDKNTVMKTRNTVVKHLSSHKF